VRDLDSAGIEVVDVRTRRSTLDDVFFALTGRPAGDEEAGADPETEGAGGADPVASAARAAGVRR
jgi:Arc/MetJ family transcription regulator